MVIGDSLRSIVQSRCIDYDHFHQLANAGGPEMPHQKGKKIENEWNKNVWQWELTNMAQIPLTSIKSKWTMKLLREAVYENEGIDTSCRSLNI